MEDTELKNPEPAASSAVAAPAKALKRRSKGDRGERLGYLFIMPNLVGFVLFTLFGIIFSLIYAFTDWNLLKGFEIANFNGLENFKRMFSDMYLGACLRNNAILLLTVPVSLFLAAILANIMNRSIYGKAGARALFRRLTKQAFEHRRKQLGSIFKGYIQSTARAEELANDDWIALTKGLNDENA